jgi:light-regulated signal transduction histidine kinase (bacteriophytochrome)
MNEDLESRVTERTVELERKNVELLRINTDLDNFVYTASHDLKSPISNLTALMSVLRSSLENKISVEEKEIIKMIDHSISRFTGTINDLSEIAKIQKEVSNDVEFISLKTILQEVKENMAEEIRGGVVEIQENLTADELYFSRKNLRSILYNLLSNAVKYRDVEKNSFVIISTYIENEFTVISFRDNGLGFDMKRKDKIFSMFKRLHDHVEGSGLGLYIIKRVVENAGGKVEVESEVKKGSEFKVYIKTHRNS